MFKRIIEEVRFIQENDAVNPSFLMVVLLYPSFHIRCYYSLANLFKKIHLSLIAMTILQFGRFITGIEINQGANLGKRVFFDHGMGVVIGSTAIIGNDVVIYHGVTLGATKSTASRRHPKVGNNVVIGAGAKLLGAITVGNNVTIGANAVVTKDVPDNCVVAGIPAQIINYK